MERKKNYSKKTYGSTPSSEFDKLPPQAPELEEAILGAIMIDKDAYSLISETLTPECFYRVAHQKIFEAIMTLAMNQEPIDMHMVTEQLRKSGTIDDIGGPYYITLLTVKVSSAAHLEYHARIIMQKFLARELIRISSEIQMKAFDDKTDTRDLIEDVELLINQLAYVSKNQFDYRSVHKSTQKPSIDSVKYKASLNIDDNREVKEKYQFVSDKIATALGYPELEVINTIMEKITLKLAIINIYNRIKYYDERICNETMTNNHAENSLLMMLREEYKIDHPRRIKKISENLPLKIKKIDIDVSF